MSLKAINTGSYRSKAGNRVFTYIVKGTVTELARYKEAQGDRYVENNEKVPMFFLTKLPGVKLKAQIDLTVTTNNRVVVDDTADVLKRELVIDNAMIDHQARIRAELEEGITKRVDTRTAVTIQPAASNATPATATSEDAAIDELDKQPEQIGEGEPKNQAAGSLAD